MNFIWNSDVTIDEPVIFKEDFSGRVTGKLLFYPSRIDCVKNYLKNTTYQEGRDFIVCQTTGLILLPNNSQIPFLKNEDLYPCKNSSSSYPEKRKSDRYMLYSESGLIHSYQICFSYHHAVENFLIENNYSCFRLPILKKNLISAKSFSLTIFGDSISTGLNATGIIGIPPSRPPYFEILVSEIAKIYFCEVVLKNESVSGKSSEWGLLNIDEAAKHKSELVILAWGMNDASIQTSATVFKKNILAQINRIRVIKQDTEFLIISGMTANPEWSKCSSELHIEYLESLREISLEEKGILLVDITNVWLYITGKKSYLDLSGNGLNHPNDFGHEIYAQIILKEIFDMVGKV